MFDPKEYYRKNRKKRTKYQMKYYYRNKKRVLKYIRKWQKNNPQPYTYKKKKETTQWQELHKKRLLQRKIGDRLRQRLNKALIRQSSTKAKKTLSLLGCTIEEFILWLEKQFTEGMNWINYGLWEIDHIRPCIIFDLTQELEQQKCFHYTNLRPLWSKDNRSRKKQRKSTQKIFNDFS